MSTTRNRSGILKHLGNLMDDAKEAVDDLIDRAADVDHNARKTITSAVGTTKEDDAPPNAAPASAEVSELQSLRGELLALRQEVARLNARSPGTEAASAPDDAPPAQA
ncbi:hypothetical protein AB0F64_36005 [Streptomyces sp. NPDC026294]|uniref:hypothetical protein n=1 Tax=Streptomyces sp. NPDC026294 TaxID=3155362 RepID=UPI0033E82EAF